MDLSHGKPDARKGKIYVIKRGIYFITRNNSFYILH